MSNRAKHGITLSAASALWKGPFVTIPSIIQLEERHLAIGHIDGKHWTAIYTKRGDSIRLISARRSRENENELYENHFQ